MPVPRFPRWVWLGRRAVEPSGWVRGTAPPASPGRFSDSSGRAGGPCLFGFPGVGYGISGPSPRRLRPASIASTAMLSSSNGTKKVATSQVRSERFSSIFPKKLLRPSMKPQGKRAWGKPRQSTFSWQLLQMSAVSPSPCALRTKSRIFPYPF